MPTEKTYTVYTIDELSPEAKKKAIEEYRERITPFFSMEHDTGFVEQMLTDLKSMGFRERFKTVEFDEKVAGRFTGKKKTKEERVEPDIRYSLGHSQGDGVAFYGKVDVWKLLDYFANTGDQDSFITEKRREQAKEFLKKLEDLGVKKDTDVTIEVTPNSYGNHYSHARTMDFDWYEDIEIAVQEAAEGADEVKKRDAIAAGKNLSMTLMEFVTETLRDVSRGFEKTGYEEIEYHFADEQIEERAKEAEIEFHKDGRLFKA